MPIHRTQFDWGLWLKWVLAMTVGSAAYVLASYIFGVYIISRISNDHWLVVEPILQAGYGLIDAGLGLIVGVAQWLVLRRQLDRAGWWIVATAVGFGMGYYVDRSLHYMGLRNSILSGLARNAAEGTVIGVMQWLVLRRQLDHAGWWIPAVVAGGIVSMAVYAAVLNIFVVNVSLIPLHWHSEVAFQLAGGAIWGNVQAAITAPVLVFLLRQRKSGNCDVEQVV